MATPFLPDAFVALVDKLGVANQLWRKWFEDTTSQIANTTATLGHVLGVNRLTLGAVNALNLGTGDAGYTVFLTTYAHLAYWDGAAWQRLDGDAPGAFHLCAVAPGVGFQLCDGTATDYLVFGAATITAPAFTTPNVPAGTFLKSLAAYTGAIDAAIAPSVSGRVASLGGVSGGGAGDMNIVGYNAAAGAQTLVDGSSSFFHDHAAGSLAVSSASRPPALGGLLFFRR